MPSRTNGFGLGLALGVLYVPCAGPVLAAIVVAGATAQIGLPIVVLTVAFAVGTAVPLLFFALAGQRVAERVSAFRRRQRAIRVTAGVVTILLAVALVFNLPAALQRAIPDYTGSLQNKLAADHQVQQAARRHRQRPEQALSNCDNASAQLQNCGPAPDLKGITAWLNTPGDKPIDLHALHGKVVLIDFWAYSCINCQRAIPHVEGWYKAYHDSGFEVIGVHTPEYAFEKVTDNVKKGAADLGITYPVALDNSYSTWTNYRNRYWPAEYLIDASGTVRHIKFGEGDYDGTEKLIRELLTAAHPGVSLPPSVDAPDTTPKQDLTRETYFGVGKVSNYAGNGAYDQGQRDVRVSAGTARRLLCPAGTVGTGLPGRDGRQRFLEHQTELPRQERLHRRRRNRQPHRHPRRQDDNGTGQWAADVTPDRRGQRRDPRIHRCARQQRAAGVFLHLRLIRARCPNAPCLMA